MKRIAYIVMVILIVCNVISWSYLFLEKDNLFKVVFFNVGQGDAIFIETPEKEQIIIDGGADYNLVASKISKIVPFWDKQIDAVVLTHLDSDHMNGLFGVIEKYKIKNVLWTGKGKEGSEEKLSNWKKLIKREVIENRANEVLVKKGKKIIAENLSLDFLLPEEIKDDKDKNSNEDSLVVRLCYLETCFLFTGDISFNEEKKLIGENLKADILKVSHHGSKYGSSDEFLKSVSPKIAVISVGKNNYGHPDSGTIERISNVGAKIIRTDMKGDITIYSDGKNYGIVYQKLGE
ncbi:MBL fold metallo-hydrolase [bacterium]|nr:MBL fold metallo-hydrolase [bacterium]